MTPLLVVLSLFVGATLGCGAAPDTTHHVARAVPQAMPARRVERATMQTRGLTGSLATDEVREALRPKHESFARCFASEAVRLPMLAGRVTLAFHVGTDGRVAHVHPIDSTVGHREVERCIVDVAASVRFPRPHGGAADFNWPLEMDPPVGVREAITWDPGRVRRVVRARGRRVLQRCGADSDVQVTTYVSRRGRVISAGASTPDGTGAASLDCVTRAVRSWPMPRSRRYRAKVTFHLRADG